jgi:hypothetical protein
MAYRILQHEKRSDNIRIGCAYEEELSAETIITFLTTSREITRDHIGKYWSRIAIVDADTLAVVEMVYSEEYRGCTASQRVP